MYQKVIVVGNLGGDPQMRYMPDGTAVTSFNVASNRSWTDKASGQKVDETTWFRVSVWGKQAETSNQYLSKGRPVLIEGTLTPDRETGGPRIWETNDGQARASYDLRADTVKFIGGRGENGGTTETVGVAAAVVEEEDDIPF